MKIIYKKKLIIPITRSYRWAHARHLHTHKSKITSKECHSPFFGNCLSYQNLSSIEGLRILSDISHDSQSQSKPDEIGFAGFSEGLKKQFFHALYESPLESINQIWAQFQKKQELPNLEIHSSKEKEKENQNTTPYSAKWFGEQIGAGLGMAPVFAAVAGITRLGLNSSLKTIEKLSNTDLGIKARPFFELQPKSLKNAALSIGEAATSGFLYDLTFRPSDNSKIESQGLWTSRLHQGYAGAATFASLSASTLGLGTIAKLSGASESILRSPLTAMTFSGISGIPAGLVAAYAESKIEGKELKKEDALQSIASMVTGGLVLPGLHHSLRIASDGINMASGRGLSLERYSERNKSYLSPSLSKQESLFKNYRIVANKSIEEARIDHGTQQIFLPSERKYLGIVHLGKIETYAHELGHGAMETEARNLNLSQYENWRAQRELNARNFAQQVRHELNQSKVSATQGSTDTLSALQQILKDPAREGVTYREIFNQDFQKLSTSHSNTEKTVSTTLPFIEYAGKDKTELSPDPSTKRDYAKPLPANSPEEPGLRLSQRRYFADKERQVPWRTDPSQDWSNRKNELGQVIADRINSLHMSTQDLFQHLEHVNPRDRGIAKRLLELSASGASDYALLRSLRALGSTLINHEKRHDYNALFTLNAASSGNMFSYYFRKTNGLSTDNFTIDRLHRQTNGLEPWHPILLFDDISTATVEQRQKLVGRLRNKDITLIDFNPRLPDLADFAMGPQAVIPKLESLIKDVRENMERDKTLSYEEAIQMAVHRSSDQAVLEINEQAKEAGAKKRLSIIRPSEIDPELGLRPQLTKQQVIDFFETHFADQEIRTKIEKAKSLVENDPAKAERRLERLNRELDNILKQRIMAAELFAEEARLGTTKQLVPQLKALGEIMEASTIEAGQDPRQNLFVTELTGNKNSGSASEAHITHLFTRANNINPEQVITWNKLWDLAKEKDALTYVNTKGETKHRRVFMVEDAAFTGNTAHNVVSYRLESAPDRGLITPVVYDNFAKRLYDGEPRDRFTVSPGGRSELISLMTERSWSREHNPGLYEKNDDQTRTLARLTKKIYKGSKQQSSYGFAEALQVFPYQLPDNSQYWMRPLAQRLLNLYAPIRGNQWNTTDNLAPAPRSITNPADFEVSIPQK